MRVLLMIGNSNMAVRELYGMALRERYPGWGISHMSGLPANAGAIVGSYNALVYEIYRPDDPRRYQDVLALWNEIKDYGTVRLITHIEGPFADGVVDELEAQGVVCVAAPFGPETIAQALTRVAPASPVRGARRAPRSRGADVETGGASTASGAPSTAQADPMPTVNRRGVAALGQRLRRLLRGKGDEGAP